MAKTKIPWADFSWNVTSGCRRVSEGCRNCFAERMAKRLRGMGLPQYQSVVDERGWTGMIMPNLKEIGEANSWKKPQRVFVDSMADLFADATGEYLSIAFYAALWNTMGMNTKHTFMILTKRPQRALEILPEVKEYLNKYSLGPAGFPWPLRNVWMGTSVENQAAADLRIPLLLQIEAAKHFISAEPLLSNILMDIYLSELPEDDDGAPYGGKLDWVITGCETGPKRRPADINWFRSLRDQCIEANVPFFLKAMEVDGKIVPMPELDGNIWEQILEEK